MMKRILLAGAMMVSTLGFSQGKADKLGWKLGSQAYTFNRFTLAEALDKMDSVGVHYVECYNGQKLGGGMEGTFDWKMDASKQAQVKALFSKKHKKLVAYGVVSPNDEKEWNEVFAFAKAM